MIKSKRMRWTGDVAWMEGKRNTYSLLVGKPEGKRPLEDEDGCIILKYILKRDHVDWIGLALDKDQWWALVRILMNLRVP
jgi:hypothetical protein